MVWVLGPVLALVVLLKVLNIGFFAAFDRPFDIYQDVSYAGIGNETLHESIGRSHATMVLIGLGRADRRPTRADDACGASGRAGRGR